jgi:hypothetical protein
MDKGGRIDVRELLGLGLASLTVLGAQIAMTRILSLKYAANQTFLVVSFAVLGLAIGAAVAHRWCVTGRRPQVLPPAGMALFSAALAVLTASFYRNLPSHQQIILVPLPFIGVGLCIAAVFAQRSARAGYYYAVDLTGAAAGAFGAAPVLDRLPAPTALLLFVALGLASAALFLPMRRSAFRWAGAAVAAAAGEAIAFAGFPFDSGRRIPIYPDRIKDMLAYVAQSPTATLEDSRWSALGRTDLIDDTAANQRMAIFLDGAAGSPMYSADLAQHPDRHEQFENSFGPNLLLRLISPGEKRSALSIGSGGGRDVLACRLGGVGHVTAVELNADVIEIAREQSDFNGNIYEDGPSLDVVIEEGRHFLRGSDRTWDLILLSIPVTKRGESYGGFALSESYIFTRESISEYLNHLTERGRLLIVCHSRQEVGRLINTYLEAVAERGLTPREAMQHVAVFGEMLITLVITPGPTSQAFWNLLEREVRWRGLARPDDRFFFIPRHREEGGVGSRELTAVASGARPAVVFPRQSTSTFEPDMSAVSDDRPFFYFFTETLPPLVTVVLAVSGGVLILMLAGSLRKAGESAGPGFGQRLLWPVAVAGLGVGFMLVEVPLIQRFVFWFGRPTLALGLLLGTLLLATGIGSLLAGALVRGRLARTWPVPAVLGAFLLLAFSPVQRLLFADATGTFADAFLRSLLITCPVGLCMGVPFPMLLTEAGRRSGISVAWLWGINGVGSVLGSAAAVAIAMRAGYSYAIMLAGLLYLITAVVIFLLALRRGQEPTRLTEA